MYSIIDCANHWLALVSYCFCHAEFWGKVYRTMIKKILISFYLTWMSRQSLEIFVRKHETMKHCIEIWYKVEVCTSLHGNMHTEKDAETYSVLVLWLALSACAARWQRWRLKLALLARLLVLLFLFFSVARGTRMQGALWSGFWEALERAERSEVTSTAPPWTSPTPLLCPLKSL